MGVSDCHQEFYSKGGKWKSLITGTWVQWKRMEGKLKWWIDLCIWGPTYWDGDIMPEVNSSIEKVSRAFVSQRISTFNNPNLSISTKRAVYKAVILAVLLYGWIWDLGPESSTQMNAACLPQLLCEDSPRSHQISAMAQKEHMQMYHQRRKWMWKKPSINEKATLQDINDLPEFIIQKFANCLGPPSKGTTIILRLTIGKYKVQGSRFKACTYLCARHGTVSTHRWVLDMELWAPTGEC